MFRVGNLIYIITEIFTVSLPTIHKDKHTQSLLDLLLGKSTINDFNGSRVDTYML